MGNNGNDFGLNRKDLYSETGRMIYGDYFGKEKTPERKKQVAVQEDEKPKQEKQYVPPVAEPAEQKQEEVKRQEQVKKEPVKEEKPDDSVVSIDDLVSNITKKKVQENISRREVKRPEGNPPSPRDFITGYFEDICGIIGERKGSFRTLLCMINNQPVNYVGPSSAGKSKMKTALRGLLPKDSYLELTTPDEFKEALESGEINGKVLSVPEFQIILRDSKNRKDVLKLMINNEYKNASIKFFVTSVATDDPYFKKYIATNKQLMRRLNNIFIQMGHDKWENIQAYEIEKSIEGAFLDDSKRNTVEHYREWMNYLRNIKLGKISDPLAAFHRQYFIDSPKAGDVLKRYQKLERALLKMSLEESTYDVYGKKIPILSIREKYRVDRLRELVNQEIKELDGDARKMLKKEYKWPEEDIKKYFESVERSKQECDWQIGWESALESLNILREKNLIPASVVAEYINRHVVNGKVTVVDDYTGEVVVLAEHPPKQEINKDAIIVTDLERVFEPEVVEEQPYGPQPLPEHQGYAIPLEEQKKKMLCLPPGRGGE